MKEFTEQQVDDMLKLKFGAVVSSYPSTSYVSNRVLGKVFGVSASQVRRLYMQRFEAKRRESLPLMARLQSA